MPFNTQPPYRIDTVIDVKATRALDTTYTNQTGKNLMVFISVNHRVTVGGGEAYVVARTPFDAGNGTFSGLRGTPVMIMNLSLSMVVPSGSTYRLESSILNGQNLIESWFEGY